MDIHEADYSISDCNTLPELFELWRKAHSSESGYEETTVTEPLIKDNKVFPGIDKNAFISDGYICENEYRSSPVKILFILKEANIQAYRSEKALTDPAYDSQISFYTDYIDSADPNPDVLNRPRQQEKMGRMAHYLLYHNDTTDASQIKMALRKTAFMNINKRGGNNKERKVYAYSVRYAPFIKRQIEILAPDIAVVIGKNIKEQLFMPNGITVLKFNHTADRYHRIYKTDAYIEKFIDYVDYKRA